MEKCFEVWVNSSKTKILVGVLYIKKHPVLFQIRQYFVLYIDDFYPNGILNYILDPRLFQLR